MTKSAVTPPQSVPGGLSTYGWLTSTPSQRGGAEQVLSGLLFPEQPSFATAEPLTLLVGIMLEAPVV